MTTALSRGPFSPLSRATRPARTRSKAARVRARIVARMVVITAVFLGLVSGPGTAYASAIDILPNFPSFVAKGVMDAESFANGVGITGLGADAAEAIGTVALAPAAVEATTVTALVVGGSAAAYIGWKAGDKLGRALPCLDCQPGTTAGGRITVGTVDTACWYLYPIGSYNPTCTDGGITASNFPPDASHQWRTWVKASVGSVTIQVYCPTATGEALSQSSATSSGAGNSVALVPCKSAQPSGVTFTSDFPTHVDELNSSNSVIWRWGYQATGTAAGPTGEQVKQHNHSDCWNAATGTVRTVYGDSAGFSVTDTLDPVTHTYSTMTSDSFPAITLPACLPTEQRIGFGSDVVPLSTGSSVGTTPILPPYQIPDHSHAPAAHPEYEPCLPGGAQYPCKLALTHKATDGTTRPYDPATDYPINDPVNDPDGHKIPADVWGCTWGTIALLVEDCKPIWNQPPRVQQKPPQADNCSFSNFTLNPVSWVVTPLKCLFIPSADAMTRWQATLTSIEATPLVQAGNGIINWIRVVISDLSGDSNQSAVACPTNDNGGGPVHWCQIVKQAGDMTQLNDWGRGVFTFAKIILYVFFGLAWYNKITASIGSKSQT